VEENSDCSAGFRFRQYAGINLAVRRLAITVKIPFVYHAIAARPKSPCEVHTASDVFEILINNDSVNAGRGRKLSNPKTAKRTRSMPIQRRLNGHGRSIFNHSARRISLQLDIHNALKANVTEDAGDHCCSTPSS
jgi:hypothetical protein